MRWFAILVAGAALIAAAWMLPFAAWTIWLADRIQSMGMRGVLLFIAIYVLWTIALLPGALLTLMAGFAYGPVGGLLVASPASVLGATAAFMLGRGALRSWARRKISHLPRTRALSDAIGRDSFKIILLLRLSPVVPFSVLNYALSLSEARLDRYVAASIVGMLPGTWLYVYLGSLGTTAANVADASSDDGRGKLALTLVGLAATVLAVALVTRSARQALDRELGE
jgi:uncharacterized membrane protein YdjX (TVP38/TMEM64 family)